MDIKKIFLIFSCVIMGNLFCAQTESRWRFQPTARLRNAFNMNRPASRPIAQQAQERAVHNQSFWQRLVRPKLAKINSSAWGTVTHYTGVITKEDLDASEKALKANQQEGFGKVEGKIDETEGFQRVRMTSLNAYLEYVNAQILNVVLKQQQKSEEILLNLEKLKHESQTRIRKSERDQRIRNLEIGARLCESRMETRKLQEGLEMLRDIQKEISEQNHKNTQLCQELLGLRVQQQSRGSSSGASKFSNMFTRTPRTEGQDLCITSN